MIRTYGWKRSLPDHRDKVFAFVSAGILPQSDDLRSQMPPVWDQAELGSCTAHALGGAIAFDEMRQKLAPLMPSRLFIYYGERKIEGTIKSDAGADIRDGCKVLASNGVCDEALWPYNTAKFKNKPTKAAYANALKHKAVLYGTVPQTEDGLKATIAGGFPIVFGISVYASFESRAVAASGVVPIPSRSEAMLGGHAILLVGYDDATRRFRFRNSWGTSWGQAGYGELPYDYVLNANLASDFWAITSVETPAAP